VRALFQSRAAALVFLGLAALAVLTGWIMIERSSTIAVDGHRHFALFDDGMITMRYADNLVSGRGLVWNPGERVEGFSSPLWVFVLAGFIVVFGRETGVAAVQGFGLALVVADMTLVALIAGRLLEGRKGRDIGALGAVFLTVTFYPLFFWSIMGMETGLLVPVLLLVVLLSLRQELTSRGRLIIALLLSFACLLRPETLLFVVVHYAFEGVRRWRSGVRARKALVAEGALLVLPVLAYQVFRLAYYRRWIANSHRLKLGGLGLTEQLGDGWRFCEPFLMWAGWLALALVLYLIVHAWRTPRASAGAGGRASERTGDRMTADYLFEFLLLFVAYALYQIGIGGDAWPLYVRFPAPATVLLIIAFAVAAVLACAGLARARLWSGSVLAVTFLLLLRWTASLYRADLFTLTPIYSGAAAADIDVALAIQRLTDESATVATFAAGVIPYYSQRRAIDVLGKCDVVVAGMPVRAAVPWHPQAGRPGHNKYDLDYSIKQMRPTAIQWIDLPPCTWGEQNLSQWCRANYNEVDVAGTHFLLDKQSPLVKWNLVGAGRR